jgi:hypothetical protein
VNGGVAPRRRRILAAGALAAAAAGALAFTAASPEPAQAKAPTLIHTYRANSVQCVPAGNNVRAKVNLWMRVVNYSGVVKGDWADHMEAKVRLEPTDANSGIQWQRNWKHSKTPYLTQDRTHTYSWALATDVYRPDASWKVHVKLIWHRPAPHRNITVDRYLRFNSNCVDATGTGTLLPAAPAIPSANGGS